MNPNGRARTTATPVLQRLEELQRQLTETDTALLGAQAALAVGTGDADAVAAAEARAGVLRRTIADLEQRAQGEAQVHWRAEAEARLTAIRRAHGSLLDQYEHDVARLQEGAAVYVDVGSRVRERVERLRKLGAEQNALLDRFPGLCAPPLPTVTPPGRHEGVTAAVIAVDGVAFRDHLHVTPAVEDDAHKIRRRRTYGEINGTPAYEIIAAAGGPKPWPELSERQRQIIAERERQQAQEGATMQRFAVEADRSLERSTL